MIQPHAFTIRGEGGQLRQLVSQIMVIPDEALRASSPAFSNALFHGQAIWDTGATSSAISPKVVKALGLKPISYSVVHGVNGSQQVGVHAVEFGLPNRVLVRQVRACEATNLGEYDVLIGMDVINTGDFSITNANGITCFSFRFPPKASHTDYVAEINSGIQRAQNTHNSAAVRAAGGVHRKSGRSRRK